MRVARTRARADVGAPSSPASMRRRAGFTLVELLVIIVIIAILTSVAIFRSWKSREKAFVSTMQSDLRALVMAQENLRSDSAEYTTDLAQLGGLRPSASVTLDIDAADAATWHATARHPGTPIVCEITAGQGTPGANQGQPVCVAP